MEKAETSPRRSATPPKAPLSTTHPKHMYHPTAPPMAAVDEAHESQLRDRGYLDAGEAHEYRVAASQRPAPEAVSDEVMLDRAKQEIDRLQDSLEEVGKIARRQESLIDDLRHANAELSQEASDAAALRKTVSELQQQNGELAAALGEKSTQLEEALKSAEEAVGKKKK